MYVLYIYDYYMYIVHVYIYIYIVIHLRVRACTNERHHCDLTGICSVHHLIETCTEEHNCLHTWSVKCLSWTRMGSGATANQFILSPLIYLDTTGLDLAQKKPTHTHTHKKSENWWNPKSTNSLTLCKSNTYTVPYIDKYWQLTDIGQILTNVD